MNVAVLARGTPALVVVVLLFFGTLERFELQALNGLFHLRGPSPPQTPISIVAIDEDSFDALNLPWPWPRRLHAELLGRLREGGAAVVGMDLLFSEPSTWGEEDDQALARAVKESGNVVLAAALTESREASFVKKDLNAPLPEIREGAAAFAPVNFTVDADAFVRSTPLVHEHQGRDLPGFALAVYRIAAGAGVVAEPIPGGGVVFINFRGGPRTFDTVSYHRVLGGEVPPETFRGQIVLVGATSLALHDVFATPFASSGTMPGVEIHANLLETLARGIELRRAPRALVALLALLAGALAAWVTARSRPLVALAWVAATVLVYLGAGFAAFVAAEFRLDQIPVPAALVLTYGTTTVEGFIREQRERRRLSRFFSPSVVEEIVRQRDERALGSARRVVSVLFCDIRGFTSLSERLPPEDVAELLREYMTSMTEAAFRHGGTVDKFIGDAIMVLYNAPLDQPEHELRAVETALELGRRAVELSERWAPRLGMPLRNGVGIHTGEAVVGVLGSEQRLEYTAVGDTVNLAARLEGLTRDLPAPIIVSESTYAAVRERFPGRPLGEVTVKGKEIPVRIYGIGADAPEAAAIGGGGSAS
ncbi:MAG: CHASE2 domain-containing protein [Candidatus Binatia bacterium]